MKDTPTMTDAIDPEVVSAAQRSWRDSSQEHRDYIAGRAPHVAWQAGYATRLDEEQAGRVDAGHMSGPDHYRTAEVLLEAAQQSPPQPAQLMIAEAQVHATLALTAATIFKTANPGPAARNRADAWAEATS